MKTLYYFCNSSVSLNLTQKKQVLKTNNKNLVYGLLLFVQRGEKGKNNINVTAYGSGHTHTELVT